MQQTIENKNVLQIGKISDRTATLSFLIGTIIFLYFLLFNRSVDVELLGFLFLIIAFLINLVWLIILLFCLFSFREYTQYFLTRIGILLLNIPIAIAFTYISLSLPYEPLIKL